MPVRFSRDTKIWIGWGFVVVAGLYSFVLSKRSIDQKRYENMKIRERMRQAIISDSAAKEV